MAHQPAQSGSPVAGAVAAGQALAMSFSSVSVIGNALHLRRRT